MFKVTDEEIEELIKKEYDGAMEKGLFASEHEFAAVLREEIEEAEEEVNKLTPSLNHIWDKIKDDDDKYMDIAIDYIKIYATNAIKELLQVCAVVDKRINNGLKTNTNNELDGIVHILHCSNCGAEIEYKVPSDIKEKSAISDKMINREEGDFDDNIVKTYSY